jgi:hypothetical protein
VKQGTKEIYGVLVMKERKRVGEERLWCTLNEGR